MHAHIRSVRLALVIVTVFGICFSGLPLPAAAAPSPQVAWSPCYRDFGHFECAAVQVPIDHSDHGLGTISIAMIRLPASDPANRIGSLFLNPGGPGGSGVDFALFLAPFLFNAEVRARFDIVGFDPRGIARSTALRCFGTPRQWTAYFTPFAFPSTAEEEAIWEAADQFLVDACEQRGTRIIDHMSTADVARDLDLLRQAVGDDQLSYAGYSYGSYLGVTYASLFPDKVRAVVVDGVLDPIAWATGGPGEGDTIPFSTRLRSDAGAQATLGEFFRLCDAGGANCVFGPDSAARYAALAARLKTDPISVTLPDGTTFFFGYSDLIANTLGALYDSFAWPSFAQFLAAMESQASAAAAGASLQALWEQVGLVTKRGFPTYPNYVEGFPGVACADTDNPGAYAAWSAAGAAAEATYGYFGRLWTWVSSICARWPGSQADRFAGPFTAATANPVLVVGTAFDPATRYEGAVTVAGLLPNSRLLTVNGWGHTSLFLSVCADEAISAYLLSGTPPAPGLTCEQDLVPFLDFGAASASASPAALGRALMVRLQVPAGVLRVVR
jgi:pimeloyl-ACP methyl ester carboxylesterase